MVSIPRFKRALDRWEDRLKERLFTPGELRYCETRGRPEVHLATRFAAKEALLKALGTGLTRGITFQDIEIISRPDGPPEIALHNQAFVISVTSRHTGYHLSLTHTVEHAAASVVAVGG